MTKRFLLVLPLAAAMVMPAAAQTSSSDPNQGQATSTQGQSSAASTDNAQANQQGSSASGRQPLQYEKNEGFWGKINPFARKKYVQRQLEPIRGRVNELDELTAANSKAIKDVDARAQEGIRMAHAKATEADQRAVDAGSRADSAKQTATQAGQRLQTVEQVVGNIDQYQPATQAEIRFRSGQTALSSKAKAALDELAESVKGRNGYIIEVQGFAPGRGTAAVENSQRMAQSVVRYLVLNHNIPVYRIHTVAMGSSTRASADAERPRRVRTSSVEVTVLKNNVDQLASMTAGDGSAMQGGTAGTATVPSSNAGQNSQFSNQPMPSSNTSQQQPPQQNP